MTTITIRLSDNVARYVEDSAQREHKSVSEWVEERVSPHDDSVSKQTTGESHRVGSGYSQDWLALFGSLSNDDSFVAPVRSESRPVCVLNME